MLHRFAIIAGSGVLAACGQAENEERALVAASDTPAEARAELAADAALANEAAAAEAADAAVGGTVDAADVANANQQAAR